MKKIFIYSGIAFGFLLMIIATMILLSPTNTNVIISQENLEEDVFYETESVFEKIKENNNKRIIVKEQQNEIGNIELLTDFNQKVPFGKDIPVYMFKITMPSENANINSILHKVDIYDKKRDYQKIDKQIRHQYRVQTGFSDFTGALEGSVNGSIIGKTGEYPIYEWVDIDLSNPNLPSNELIIRGVVDVELGEEVEWIPTFFKTTNDEGLRITEWASWTSSLETELRSYFAFNETGNPLVDVVSGLNGTGTGTNFAFARAGIRNGSVFGDNGGINSEVNFSNVGGKFGVFTDGIYSVSLWSNTAITSTASEAFSFRGEALTELDRNSANSSYVWQVNGIGDMHVNIPSSTWFNVILTSNSTDRRIYRNGVLVAVGSASTPSATGDQQKSSFLFDDGGGYWDEVAIWNRSLTPDEVTYLYDGGTGTFRAPITNLDATITLNNPLNDTTIATGSSGTASKIFNASLNSPHNFTNATLNIWFFNHTLAFSNFTTTPNDNDTIINISSSTIPLGDFVWNIRGCVQNSTGSSNCTIDAQNNTFYVRDMTANFFLWHKNSSTFSNRTVDVLGEYVGNPFINLTWPLNNTVTISPSQLVNATLSPNRTSEFNFSNIPLGIFDIGVVLHEANSSSAVDTWAQRNRTLTRGYVFNSDTNSSPVLELSRNSFILNVTLPSPLTSSDGFFTYNGTESLADKSSVGGNTIYNITISAPQTNTNVNISWRWELRLADTSSRANFNITSGSQDVHILSIDDCSTQTELLFNYTLFDEEDLTLLNGTSQNTSIQIELTLTDIISGETITFARNYNRTNPARICGGSGTINSSLRTDVLTRYTALDYVVEFHNIQNATLSEDDFPMHVPLYPLLSVDSQEFLTTFKDENFVPVEDALITVTRKYIGEGLFRTVEAPLTNNDGQAIIHLVLSDQIYTIQVSKNGQTLGTFDNIVAFCNNVATGDCTINLNAFSTGIPPEDFETKNNLSYIYDFDKDARTLTVTFNTLDGSVSTINLTGILFDNFGNNTACSNILQTSSGSITCNIPIAIGNSSIRANLYKDGSFVSSAFFSLTNSDDTGFGFTGTLMMAILYMTIPLMMITSGAGIVIGAILGLIFAGLLNLYTGGGIIGVGSTIIWFIIAGAIILWKINSMRQ